MTVLESRKARLMAAGVRDSKGSSRCASTGRLHASQTDPATLASNTEEAAQERFRRYSPTMEWEVHGY